MTALGPCPSDSTFVALVEGRLSDEEMSGLRAHVAACASCDSLVKDLGAAAVRATTLHRAAASVRSTPADSGGVSLLTRTGFEARARGASVGRYLVLSLLGRGGMGEVYEAYDPQLDRRVALKLLHTAAESAAARKRLSREAWALAQLSHPNVVQVYDVGEHDGDVFVAMELVEGQSLDAWCRGPERPAWRVVLEAYLDAARGLAAAQAKGLVHRDVKPSNILRGKDGRVRVADFGLVAGGEDASAAAEAPSTTQPSPSALVPSSRLTATGALPGTPLYMAPEQFERGEATAASDQYSLCVALYEGLYGVLPFEVGGEPGKRTLLAVFAAKKEKPRRPPDPGDVPPAVFEAVARGLAPEPGDRHASMNALVDALSLAAAPPRGRTRAAWLAAGAAAAILVAVVASGWKRSGAAVDPCAHPEQQLAGAWDDGVKQRVRAALAQSGRPYARDTADRVASLLDRQAESWASMRGEVCAAARTQKESQAIVALREACLERRRSQLQALTSLLAERPDPDVLDRGVEAAQNLTPVAGCADIEALTSRVRPPEDPALRARVEELQPRIDRLEALYTTGQYKTGIAEGRDVLAQAAAVPYPLLSAQAKRWLGQMHESDGEYDAAKQLLEEAAALAAEGGDDVLVAEAWARVLLVVGDKQEHFDEAGVLRAVGPTLLARAHDDRARAAWLSAEGAMLGDMGKFDEAKAVGEEALALAEKAVGPETTFVADSLVNLSDAYFRSNDFAAARRLNERALAIRTELLGPEHPYVGLSTYNIGAQTHMLGDVRSAMALYDRALVILQSAFGPRHRYVSLVLDGLGAAHDDLGEWDEAVALGERALAVREATVGPDHSLVALAASNLATYYLHRGEVPRAESLGQRALVIWEKALGPSHPDVAYALAVLGRVRTRQGRLDDARALLERGRAVREKQAFHEDAVLSDVLQAAAELELARAQPARAVSLVERALAVHGVPARANETADMQLLLAEALWRAGQDRPRARALAEEARAAYERLGHKPGLETATRWLAGHPA